MKAFFRSQYIRLPCPIPCSIFAKTTLGPGFVSISPARIIRIARLVPFDELKQRHLSEGRGREGRGGEEDINKSFHWSRS